jgi:hypothetical protein
MLKFLLEDLVENHMNKMPVNTFMMMGLLGERSNPFRRVSSKNILCQYFIVTLEMKCKIWLILGLTEKKVIF